MDQPLLNYHPGEKRGTARAALYVLVFACAQFLTAMGGMCLLLRSWPLTGLGLLGLTFLASVVCTMVVGVSYSMKVEPDQKLAVLMYSVVAATLIPTGAMILEGILGVALWAR